MDGHVEFIRYPHGDPDPMAGEFPVTKVFAAIVGAVETIDTSDSAFTLPLPIPWIPAGDGDILGPGGKCGATLP